VWLRGRCDQIGQQDICHIRENIVYIAVGPVLAAPAIIGITIVAMDLEKIRNEKE
jgi:hypothetical protein